MDRSQKLIGQTFAKNYRLVSRIGAGAFGEIYTCINKQNQEELAIKLEPMSTQFPQLLFEGKLYTYFHNAQVYFDKGIPRIHYYGSENNYNILVMDKLGKSLETLFVQQKNQYSLKTVCMLGDQMIQRLEFIHGKQFIHRDIKPDNFLMGTGKRQNKLYIIDFGLSKRYMSKDGQHIAYKTGKNLTGTARYASINTHMGLEQSRRDDIESVGYVLLYFLRGMLPWQNLQANSKAEKYKKIMETKINTSSENLCKNFPQEFVKFLNYCKNLKFDEQPDYQYLRGLFKDIMTNFRYEYDFMYDWTLPETSKKRENSEENSIYKSKLYTKNIVNSPDNQPGSNMMTQMNNIFNIRQSIRTTTQNSFIQKKIKQNEQMKSIPKLFQQNNILLQMKDMTARTPLPKINGKKNI